MFYIDKDDVGTNIYFLGRKLFRIKKSWFGSDKQEMRALSSIVRASVTASSLPKAEGVLREIQLADLRILREVDRVAREAGLTWWIDFGTLLGAVRHGGFIPWDDDIDICMVREDYTRFVEVFNRLKCDDDLEAMLSCASNGRANLIKVQHRRLKGVFIDIFPVDVCAQTMDDAERLAFSKELRRLTKKNRKRRVRLEDVSSYHAMFGSLRKKHLPPDCSCFGEEAQTVYYGCEYCHVMHQYNAFAYQDIFPLGTISFEGEEFPCVANPDRYLTYVFGDYMALPRYIHTHVNLKQFSPQDIFAIRAYSRGELL